MAFIRLPGGIKVALEYEVFGKVVVNVYHVTTPDPITTIKLVDVTEIFRDWFITSLADGVTADIGLTGVTATNLDEEAGEKSTLVVSPAEVGQVGGDAVMNNVALVASFATAKTGRSFRGRSYIAGIPVLNIAENEVTTVFAAFFVNAFAVLISDLDIDNDVLVVASFQSGSEPRVLGVATPVDSVSVNQRIDTQRRRLPKS